ncbi:MAG: hypothetical protein LBP41_02375 [Holosporaceae bacterium]|jgi:hypothetical protein|nr:hypothetical protein [Holosporaceae bacterium]
MKKLFFFVAAFGCSTSSCLDMDVVFSNPQWSKSIADLKGPFGLARRYPVSDWDQIQPEVAKKALHEMITVSWGNMTHEEQNKCLLKENEIFAFEKMPDENAKMLLAYFIESSGWWVFHNKDNPDLHNRISEEWKTLESDKLLNEIVDFFIACLTPEEKRTMVRSRIYAGECKIPIEKSLKNLDELSDDIIYGVGFGLLKGMVSIDHDVINGMPKEEFWKLSDEEWRKFHSFHKDEDEDYDTTELQTALRAQIGGDQVAQEAFRIFLDSRPRALIDFFCDNHTKMTPDNAKRFKELSILIAPGVESELHKQKVIGIIGDQDSVVSTDFQFLPFCTDMLFAGAVESAKQGYFTMAMMFKDAYRSAGGKGSVEESMYGEAIFEEDWKYIDYDLKSVWRNLKFPRK